MKLNLAGWGNKQFLSGEKWLHLSIDASKIEKELPAEGGRVRYDFDVNDSGNRTSGPGSASSLPAPRSIGGSMRVLDLRQPR